VVVKMEGTQAGAIVGAVERCIAARKVLAQAGVEQVVDLQGVVLRLLLD
jgi:hypothetical protein